MIKVTENGVPLAAIVSVEINDVDEVWGKLCAAVRVPVAFMPNPFLIPTLKLPMTEAEARRLRDEWRKQWPEVAAYLDDK